MIEADSCLGPADLVVPEEAAAAAGPLAAPLQLEADGADPTHHIALLSEVESLDHRLFFSSFRHRYHTY